MHHMNTDAPPDGPPRPFGAPARGRRARASGCRMPVTTLSGYEQILAARAAMRAQVERDAAVHRHGFIAPKPAPAGGRAQRARRRAGPRRLGLILSGVAAAPVCALLALAWVEPPRAPNALPAGPAPGAGISPPPFGVAVATAAAPTAEADGPVSAEQDPDAPSWTAEAEPGAPRGNAAPEPDPGPEHAGVEPAPSPMEHAGPALLAARDQDAPPPAADAETAEPPQGGTSWSMLGSAEAGNAEAEEQPTPGSAVAAAATEEPAAGPAVAAAAAEEPAPGPAAAGDEKEPVPGPAVAEAEETADDDGTGAEAVAVATGSDTAGALPETADADTTGPQARREAPPAPIPAPPAEAPLKASPPPAAKLAVAAEPPPPLPPWVRAAPAKNRAGEPPPAPQVRAVRAADGASPSAEARCRAIIVRFQLGEETSHADRSYLQTSCGARRR